MQGCTTTVTSEVKSESSHGVHTFRKLYTFHCGVLDHHKNWPHTILTNLEIPSRLGHHLISWKSIKSNHISIKLAQAMFSNACDG